MPPDTWYSRFWCSHSASAPPKWMLSWKIRQSCLDPEKLALSVLFCKGLDSMCESFAEVLHWVRMCIISGLSLCPNWVWPSMAELSISRTHDYPKSSTFITVNVIKLWCLKIVLLLQGKRINMFYPCEHIIWLLSSLVYKLEAKILSIKTQCTILVFLIVKC